MGYSTKFLGELRFTNELTAKQIALLSTFMGEDCRCHSEWDTKDMTFIDLEINNDFTGIRWDGSEKTYDLVEKVNFIIKMMQSKFPSFGLTGEIQAQGEGFDDRWILRIVDGIAVGIETPFIGDKITCPHCEEEFILEK